MGFVMTMASILPNHFAQLNISYFLLYWFKIQHKRPYIISLQALTASAASDHYVRWWIIFLCKCENSEISALCQRSTVTGCTFPLNAISRLLAVHLKPFLAVYIQILQKVSDPFTTAWVPLCSTLDFTQISSSM